MAVVAAGLAGAVPQAASAAPARPAASSAAQAKSAAALAAARAASVPAADAGTSTPAGGAAAALAAARSSGQATAVAADQTSFSQTFANPDGSFTTTTSVLPRWAQRGSSWVTADATLVKQPDGSYAPKAALGALTLSGGGTDVLATAKTGTQTLSVTWPQALPAPAVSGARATYPDVFPGVDLVVTAGLAGGFSETLVIKDQAAAADPQLKDLSLGVSASSGLTARAGSNGSLTEENSSGKPVFFSPAPAAWDSRAAGATAAGPRIAGAGVVLAPVSYSDGSVKLGVPASLMSDPAADFPLYVDPAYSESPWWQGYGEIQSAFPDNAEFDSTYDGNAGVGWDGGSIDRGEYVFGLPAQADSAAVTVTSATMTANAAVTFTSASTSHTINAYSTSEYTSSSTWNSPPTVLAGPSAQTFTTTSTSPNHNVSWNVASWVQSAYNSSAGDLSVQLNNADETDENPYVEFGQNATLSYTYTQPAPTVPVGTGPVPGATFLNFPVSDKVSLKVNVGSGDALLTTADLTMPEAGGGLTLGADYNSLLAGTAVTGAEYNGWRQREGVDVRLYLGSGNTVTFLGQDGTAGVFTLSGSTYTSPADIHATLTSPPASGCSGSAYELTWHSTGAVMCFNGAGLLTSQADRNHNTTGYSYDGNGLETQVTYTPAGASSPTETVTAAGSWPFLTGLSESGGAAGTKNVTYTINSSSDLTSVQQPDGTLVKLGYDTSHNLTTVQIGTGAVTHLAYNSARQVTSVSQTYGTSSATATTRLSYVSATETQVAAPDTNQAQAVSAVPNTTYTVNSAGLVTAAKDPGGNTASATYNSTTNNVATAQNQLGGTTTNTWGSNNGESLTKTVSPTGAFAAAAYGNANSGTDPTAEYLPSSSNDAQANQTLYTYDGAGNPLQSSDALPAVAKVTPNSDGTPSTSTDPDGGVTSYGYNALHQLTTVTPPTSGSLKPLSLTYDGFGRVATVLDGNGNTLTYTYDPADRITKEAFTGGTKTVTVSYAYDGAGNLKTQTAAAATTSWTHDGRNQVLTVSATSGGGTLSYSYDADGNMLTAKDGAGTASYTYNSLDQLTALTDPTGVQWQFSYNAAGERTATYYSATSPSPSTYAAEEALSYDKAGRITSVKATGNSGAATLASTSYCYSPYVSGSACPTASASTDTELLKYSVNNQTSAVTQYGYDSGNRLKTVTPTSGTTYSYGYDNDGNITAGSQAGSLTYNTSNQITADGATYDHDGSENYDPGNGTLGYTDASQLVSASAAAGGGGGSAAETITYAGAGQNQPLSDGSATGITYGQGDQYGQPRTDSYTTGGATTYIIRDQQGDPLGLVRGGTSYIYLTDNSGSVTGISGSCGCSDASYTYTPYGTLASKSAGSGGSLVTQNLLGYTGELTDTYTAGSTGYVHDGARWYNPVTGDFTGQDTSSYLNNPANGNRYAYAADNPVNNIDPDGHSILTTITGAIVGATVGVFVLGSTGNPLLAAGLGGCAGAATSSFLDNDDAASIAGQCMIGLVAGVVGNLIS